VGDEVAGDDQLQGGAAGVQVGTNRGGGDVDDVDVEHRHALRAEQDGQDQPGTHTGRGDRRTALERCGHGSKRSAAGYLDPEWNYPGISSTRLRTTVRCRPYGGWIRDDDFDR